MVARSSSPTGEDQRELSCAGFDVRPLPGASFGAVVRFDRAGGSRAALAAAQANPDALPRALYACQGLLVLPEMGEISEDPAQLVRLSRLFGPEVENYRLTHADEGMIHPDVPEIFVVSNLAPANRQPPPRPDPPRTENGALPTRFPHRRGWHTDQSYRRPPPDVSLFYAVTPAPKGQGQTLYADGATAYEALPARLRQRVEGLEGIHVRPGTGRSEQAVSDGETPQPLPPHHQPQRQPVVRPHPVTGKRALYLCEAGQMDWVQGPFAGMSPGPEGDGARLLYELMTHLTQPRFTYVHEWEAGDLVIYDNRSLLHAATWFDAERYGRLMWRTTVAGNPGEAYAGEEPSWTARPLG